MLGSQANGCLWSDERCKNRYQCHLVTPVLIEQLDPAQVIESERAQTSILCQLTRRCCNWALRRLDMAMHCFPGAGAAAARASSQHETFQARGITTQHVYVYQRCSHRRHGRHSAKAPSSARPATWDFSGWNWAPRTDPF